MIELIELLIDSIYQLKNKVYRDSGIKKVTKYRLSKTFTYSEHAKICI